jgi:DNA-binding XRE family transcriptional regulator
MTKEFESPLMRFRLLRRMTQQELADELGVSSTTIRNWESGRAVPNLTIPQVKKLCQVLEVNLEDLPDDFGPQPIHDSSPFAKTRKITEAEQS